MSDTIAFLIALLGVGLMVFLVSKLPGGCSGDCQQGRKPCDCKEKK